LEREIINLIEAKGPLTGAEILDRIDDDPLLMWRTCKLSESLIIQTVGTRYLRLDRRIEGFARLSPSILREFLTYSVIGHAWDHASASRRTNDVTSHIEGVSRSKSELAYNVISTLVNGLANKLAINEQACFIIAGDIVHNMAHDVPRPERSTGKLVKGSDMDLVVIVDDLFPREAMARLDEAIYREKHSLLITPHIREEIDYIVKNLDRVRGQLRFDTFKHMVACKILHEGTLLYGSEALLSTVKGMLREKGVTKKLHDLEERARIFRKEAEENLLRADPDKIREERLNLFYPSEESEEFE
jgi:hypothetical protein